MFPGCYVSRVLCSQGAMCLGSYVSRGLCVLGSIGCPVGNLLRLGQNVPVCSSNISKLLSSFCNLKAFYLIPKIVLFHLEMPLFYGINLTVLVFGHLSKRMSRKSITDKWRKKTN